MILEYTEAESLEWKAINDKYEKTAQRITEAGIAYLDLEAVKEVFVKDTETRAKWLAELEALHDEIENRRIAAIKDDPEALLQELRKQMHLAITRAVADIVSQEVKDRQGEAMEKEFVAAKQEGRDPQFVKVDYRAVYDEMTASPIFTPEQARQIIEQEARKILDALQPYEKKTDIERLFAGYLKKCPFVSRDGATIIPNLPRVMVTQTDRLAYPLDKPNSVIWNLLTGADPTGQLTLNLDTGKKGSKQDAIVYYGINFDELETSLKITKQLTPFDKRVYIAAAALWNGGNEIISATQVYKMMGNSGQPKAETIKKINDSFTKMGAARVYIDSTKEAKVNKGYDAFRYDAALLPFERISAYINNTLTEAAIRLFREPPLISFARERKQITTLTRQLLESPISKTDANLLLEDYLLERIGRMKSPNSKAPRKILFSTIYDRCSITTAKQRKRAPEKITRYLEHYKKSGWIDGYKMETDGVTILL